MALAQPLERGKALTAELPENGDLSSALHQTGCDCLGLNRGGENGACTGECRKSNHNGGWLPIDYQDMNYCCNGLAVRSLALH